MILLDPKGPVGETERSLILTAFGPMLIVIIPVIVMGAVSGSILTGLVIVALIFYFRLWAPLWLTAAGAALAMMALDRYLGMHFFSNTMGGNMMMYANLFWNRGHPEVYIAILPAFGIFSEVVATFARKRLFGYTSLGYATAGRFRAPQQPVPGSTLS